MKTLIRVGILLAVVVIGGKLATERITTAMVVDSGKSRVLMVLGGIEPEVSDRRFQTAVCQWWRGSLVMSQEEFDRVAPLFVVWARKLREDAPFEITHAELEEGGGAVLVTVEGEERTLTFRAAPESRLEILE